MIANIQNFSVVRNGTVNLNGAPRYTIAAQVEDVNPATGLYEVIADFTGGAAITFPGVLGSLTAAQRDDFVQMVASWLVRVRAGLDPAG